MNLYFSIEAPYRWILIDKKGGYVDNGIAPSLAGITTSGYRVSRRIAVIPGELVTIHKLSVPAKSRSKAVAAIPYMLEEKLASDVDNLQFILLKWVAGGDSIVAVFSSDLMEHWNQSLLELPGSVDAIIPDYLLLPRHIQAHLILALAENNKIYIRQDEFSGLVIEKQELDLWWAEVDDTAVAVACNDEDLAKGLIEKGATSISHWSIGSNFTEWLMHGHDVPSGANLIQSKEKIDQSESANKWLKVAVVLLSLAFLIRSGMDGYEYFQLVEEDKQLDVEITELFKSTFSEDIRIVNPRVQMEQELQKLRRANPDNNSFQILLAAVAQAVPAARAKVEELSFRDEALLVTCSTSDFATLDILKAQFAKDQTVVVELLSSGSRDNSVNARFRLVQAG